MFAPSADGAPDQLCDFRPGVDRIDANTWGVRDSSGLELSDHQSGRVILRCGGEAVAIDDGARALRAPEFHRRGFRVRPPRRPSGDRGDYRKRQAARHGRGRGNPRLGRRRRSVRPGGTNVFVLAHDGAADSIKDFEDGLDLNDLSAWGVQSARELTITDQSSGKVVVCWTDEPLAISDAARLLTAADLGAEDFVFA